MSSINEIEEKYVQIEERLSRAEQWVATWQEVLELLANRIEEAQRSNATLVLRDVINPYADTTTVEDLLHMLESECPVTIVLDVILKKEMTLEERQRLVGNLKHISNECMKGIVEITKAQYRKSQEAQP